MFFLFLPSPFQHGHVPAWPLQGNSGLWAERQEKKLLISKTDILYFPSWHMAGKMKHLQGQTRLILKENNEQGSFFSGLQVILKWRLSSLPQIQPLCSAQLQKFYMHLFHFWPFSVSLEIKYHKPHIMSLLPLILLSVCYLLNPQSCKVVHTGTSQ